MHIETLHVKQYQSKHNLKKDSVITQRDVLGLYLIKRGSNINVKLENAGINIFFSAKALQNGRIADTISVLQKNGKKIKVKVTGRNKAEMK
jgi:flagella basal body P-ring formation protein FlgA